MLTESTTRIVAEGKLLSTHTSYTGDALHPSTVADTATLTYDG